MKDDCEDDIISLLPTEVLLYIFTFLSGKQLIRCRQVCTRWKYIVDGLTNSDMLWLKHCKKDYSDIYQIARAKARIGLVWYNIYRSLSLWPRLSFAREERDEFASASNISEEIQGFQILRDSIIGVHKRTGIFYYDTETLEVSKRSSISGNYARYKENEDCIVIINYHLQLFVIRKILQNPSFETNVTFDHVKTFMLADRTVYFVNLNNEVYSCKLDDKDLRGQFIVHSTEEPIMCLGYKDGEAYALTFDRNIYLLRENSLSLTKHIDESTNLLNEIGKYNILHEMDWRVYQQWMCILRRKIPVGPLQEIMTVCRYGEVYFVGCNWGVLRIYYKPYTNGELDFYNPEPVKQYNFMERSDCPVLTMCPIKQVDVLECAYGHRVVVCMPKKIAVIDYVHNFKRTSSVAMLPYSDVQKVKVFRFSESPI